MLRNFAILAFAVAFALPVQLMPAHSADAAPAPKPRLGKIKGEVVDLNKAKIFGAVVTIECKDFPRYLRTNAEGEFETSLPPDSYRIRVEANGFDQFVSRQFELKSGKTQRFNIEMRLRKSTGLVPAASDPPLRKFD